MRALCVLQVSTRLGLFYIWHRLLSGISQLKKKTEKPKIKNPRSEATSWTRGREKKSQRGREIRRVSRENLVSRAESRGEGGESRETRRKGLSRRTGTSSWRSSRHFSDVSRDDDSTKLEGELWRSSHPSNNFDTIAKILIFKKFERNNYEGPSSPRRKLLLTRRGCGIAISCCRIYFTLARSSPPPPRRILIESR